MASRFWSLLTQSSLLRFDVTRAHDSWESRLDLHGAPSLNTLSDDVLVDQVFSYLDVEDILSLRRVSRLYYNLTHQGIIWKRFLKRIGPSAPQLPPSSRYSPRRLTSFEAERLVVRAITLHMNWVSPRPAPLFAQAFLAHRLVQSMVVLPGGKHMVASVCNWAKNYHSLSIYALDHRVGGVVPLAETAVKQRAYNLRAKYMTIDGTPSLVIAYVRRKKPHRHSGQNVDPSIYNELWSNPRLKIDPPVPFQYVCSCVQVPLDALDTLADPRLTPGSPEFFEFAQLQPPPFRLLSVMRSSVEFGAIDLATANRIPTLAVVKGSETVVFKELTGQGMISTMNCAREATSSSFKHHICNIRMLPYQGEILVVRTVTATTPVPVTDGPGGPPVVPQAHVALAMFAIPHPGDNEIPVHIPISLVSFRADDAEDVQISDPSDYDILREKSPSAPVVAPPINIFYRKSAGRLRYVAIRPISMPSWFLCKGQPQNPYYSLDNVSASDGHALLYEESGVRHRYRLFVCPGSHRSLVYGTSYEDRTDTPAIRSIYSHVGDPVVVDEYSRKRHELLQSIRHNEPLHRSQVLAKFELCPDLRNDLRGSVQALAWDESTGRIFYVKPDDGYVRVVDLAHTPLQTKDGQRWPLPLADERMLEL